MHLCVQLTTEPIPDPPSRPEVAGAGAWTEFRGVVRGEEDGRSIVALEYEAYPGMAEREMRRIIHALAVQHPCLAMVVTHRIGIVPAGEAAIYVGIASRHRAEGFAMLAAFMDRLKQDVPLWKRRALGEIA
jgi:molybdopterin synthase catalytic subunit